MTTERRTAFVSPAFFRAILGFCLFSILALIWFRLIPKPETYDQKRAAVRLKLLQDLRLEDEKKLNSYSWIDEKKGIVRIPIERSAEIVMAELKTKAAQATAVKVENPYPTGLQSVPAPVPAATAAPSAIKAPAASPTPTTSPAPAASPHISQIIKDAAQIAFGGGSGIPCAMPPQRAQRHFFNNGLVPRVCFSHRAWNARSTFCIRSAQNGTQECEVFVQKFRS